jgi:hypothetical protein
VVVVVVVEEEEEEEEEEGTVADGREAGAKRGRGWTV